METLFELNAEVPERPRGMSQHERVGDGKEEWLTPAEIIGSLGEFDLDPCSPIKRPWDTARNHFSVLDDGLKRRWSGRVWLNPPYGDKTFEWMRRMSEHGNGIALIFARTETETWFKHIWWSAHSVFFFRGRLAFCHVDGHRARTNAGAPSVLVAYGLRNTQAIADSSLDGRLVILRP